MSENHDLNNVQPHLKKIPSWHYDMLVHQERNRFYNELIKDHCKDKVVFEIGTGSGLLSVLALRHGAKKVICCEENPLLSMAAENLFRRMGVSDRIQFIKKNSNDIKTEEIEPVDVVLHELFASDPFGEYFIPTLKDARRFMKPDAIFLPDKIQILYQAIPKNPLPHRLYFDDIELIEMGQIISQVHPALRQRQPADQRPECFALPEVSVRELIEKTYSYTETNDKLIDVDAVEVSFLILHEGKKMQAAYFEPPPPEERVHWFPLIFYKLDTDSNQLKFAAKDDIQLTVL